MKRILGYTLMLSPIWLIVAVVISVNGRAGVIAILVTSAIVLLLYGAVTLGSKLLE